MVLYGSKARGTDDSESDIDLLLITTVPVSWRERRSITDSLFDLQIEREVVISPLVISRDEWLNGVYQVLPIRREIDRDGVAA
ncbi:MAG TPA: nucleotidyltransferase domain-containing protein [Thermoanaerobaculia bacterium]|nr:nucleotidyltransferase domain-containing protein [Thermoanaerobaculia bacterium]